MSATETEVLKSNEEVTVKGITVDLLDEGVRVNMGKGLYKVISYEDFTNSLKSIISPESPTESKTEFYLPAGVAYISVSKTFLHLSCYYPETTRNVKFSSRNGKSYDRLSVIPNIIISHVLEKGTSSNEWVIKEPRYMATPRKLSELPKKYYGPNSADKICNLPFTNIYSDGRMCFGENVKPKNIKTPDLKGLHWFYEILFISPFNEDLGLPGVTGIPNVPAWFDLLADRAAKNLGFPYENLVL